MQNREGQWKRKVFESGPDSALRTKQRNVNNSYVRGNYEIQIAEVYGIHPEPMMANTLVELAMTKGGHVKYVAWPGPNMACGTDGRKSGSATAIHGLYEGPTPGWQVAVAFLDGDMFNPCIIQKYPYQAKPDRDIKSAYMMPMTNKSHQPGDVVLGHYSGSYLAFRDQLPLPGAVELYTQTDLKIESKTKIEVTAVSDISLEATANFTIKAGQALKIQNTVGTTIIEFTTSGQLNIKSPVKIDFNDGSLVINP
jgi:hypothetical protein